MIFELIAKDNKGKILASGEFDENEPFYISSDKTVDVGSFNYKKIMETMDYGVNIFEPVNDGEDFAFVYVSDDFMDYISIMLEINITKDDLIGKLFGESFPILKRIGLFLYQKSYKENKIIEFTISIFNKETRKLLAYNPQKLVRDEDKFFVLSKSDLDYKNVLKSRKNSFYNSSNALIYIAGNEIVNVNNVASKLINKSIDEIKGIKIDFNKFHFGMDSIEKTKEIYENLLNNQLYFHNWKVKK